MPVGGVVTPEESNTAFARAVGTGGDDIVSELEWCVLVRSDFSFGQYAQVKVELVDGAQGVFKASIAAAVDVESTDFDFWIFMAALGGKIGGGVGFGGGAVDGAGDGGSGG